MTIMSYLEMSFSQRYTRHWCTTPDGLHAALSRDSQHDAFYVKVCMNFCLYGIQRHLSACINVNVHVK